jgi:serine O-acetyltransferase
MWSRIPLTVKIGFGCKINHGYGLVINSKTIIGNNVTLMHNLTFSDEKGKAPVIGDRVRFTPGAVIVGDVRIGNDSVIGANCVVTKDVPDNDIAVGVPNRNLGKKYIEQSNRYYWEQQ